MQPGLNGKWSFSGHGPKKAHRAWWKQKDVHWCALQNSVYVDMYVYILCLRVWLRCAASMYNRVICATTVHSNVDWQTTRSNIEDCLRGCVCVCMYVCACMYLCIYVYYLFTYLVMYVCIPCMHAHSYVCRCVYTSMEKTQTYRCKQKKGVSRNAGMICM